MMAEERLLYKHFKDSSPIRNRNLHQFPPKYFHWDFACNSIQLSNLGESDMFKQPFVYFKTYFMSFTEVLVFFTTHSKAVSWYLIPIDFLVE